MKTSLAELLPKLPRPATAEQPGGVFDIEALSHGTMSLQLFAPRGADGPKAHLQDRLYIVAAGTSGFVLDGEASQVAAGDALFVDAAIEHNFFDMSDDFAAWVVFWGPAGGEAPAPDPSVFAAIDA